MTIWGRYSKLIIVSMLVVSACIEPYPAPDIFTTVDLLVVDGFVNATEKTADVRLTHATSLADESGPAPEHNALVIIRTEAGNSVTLTEGDSGRYSAVGLNIDFTTRYQLFIQTQSSQEYVSDYITLKQTPKIDSITWAPKEDGVEIRVNTHDITGNTRYYRWDYIETYEYHSPLLSAFKLVNHEAVSRTPDEMVGVCWRTEESKNILVASTDRLAEDVIHEFPIIYLSRASNELSVKYSALVRQRSMEEAEYEFWKDMHDVTEGLGGLFDSQPYQIIGNIRYASDTSIPVLGYFSGGTIDVQRMFLSYNELPEYLKKRPPHGCQYDTICIFRGPSTPYKCSNDLAGLVGNPFIGFALTDGPSLWGYTLASAQCADCRYGGGTVTRPSFWP